MWPDPAVGTHLNISNIIYGKFANLVRFYIFALQGMQINKLK